MRRIVSFMLIALPIVWTAIDSHAAAQQATPTVTSTTIHGTITATGRYIFTWVSDNLCTLSFWDYDFTPDLTVTDETGREIASLPLATLPGTVTMAGQEGEKHAEVCAVPYELAVPTSDTYRVLLDPYFKSDPISSTELTAVDGKVDISFERQEGDVGPDFRDRPAGKIPDTDLYRIAGTFELRGEANPDRLTFMATPFGCITTGGYADIQVGAQITVTNQTGTIIGIGELEPIMLPNDERCVFTFTIDVPDAAFYALTMGRRGDQTYSKQDLEGAGWHVDLVISP